MSYRTWMMGTKPRYPARATGILERWANFQTQVMIFKGTILQTESQLLVLPYCQDCEGHNLIHELLLYRPAGRVSESSAAEERRFKIIEMVHSNVCNQNWAEPDRGQVFWKGGIHSILGGKGTHSPKANLHGATKKELELEWNLIIIKHVLVNAVWQRAIAFT